jgi:hypothetical protein
MSTKKNKKNKQEKKLVTDLTNEFTEGSNVELTKKEPLEVLSQKENVVEAIEFSNNGEVKLSFPSTLTSQGLIWAAMGIAFVFKLLLAAYTLGTNDLFYWKMFLNVSREYGGIVLYQKLSWWNHPPMMVHVINLIGFIESIFKINFNFLFRFLPVVADIGTFLVVYKILKVNDKLYLPKLLLLALAPASIMISGFHGNTDPIMIFFVILSVYLLDISEIELFNLLPSKIHKFLLAYEINNYHLAGVAMGLAINVKIVPIILAPSIFFYLKNNKHRVEYLVSAVSIVVLTSLPYIFQDPIQVFKSTFGYSSFYGNWGLGRVFLFYFPYEHWVNNFFSNNGKFVVFGLIILVSLWMNLFGKKINIFYQVGLIFYLFMVLTPGFSVQYLAWLTPWVVVLGWELVTILYLTAGIFLFLVYTWWGGGLPWNLSSADTGDWTGIIINYELLCWGSLIVVLLAYFMHIFFEKYPKFELTFLTRQKNKIWALASILIVFICIKAFNDIVVNYGSHLYSVQAENHEARQKKILERTYIGISAIFSKNGFYKESIDYCNKVLEINPSNADAYNNMCVGYINLKDWDKAIEAGNKALAINPNDQLFRNNVVWAQSQKNAGAK